MHSGSGPRTAGLRLLGQVETVAGDVGVGLVEHRQVVGVTVVDVDAEVGAKCMTPSSNDPATAHQRDAAGGEGPEVDGVAAVCTADGDGHVLGATRRRRSIPLAENPEPPAEVAAAIASRRPVVRPDREVDLAARLLEFVGDLHARGSGSDDEDGAGGQLLRIAVGTGVNLVRFRRRRERPPE